MEQSSPKQELRQEMRTFADKFLGEAWTDEWQGDPDAATRYMLAITLHGLHDRTPLIQYMYQRAIEDSVAAFSFKNLLRVEREPVFLTLASGMSFLAASRHVPDLRDLTSVYEEEIVGRIATIDDLPEEARESGIADGLVDTLHSTAGCIIRGILNIGDVRVGDWLPIPSKMNKVGRQTLFSSPLESRVAMVRYAIRWIAEADIETSDEAVGVISALASADFDDLDAWEITPPGYGDLICRVDPVPVKAIAEELSARARGKGRVKTRALFKSLAQDLAPD